MWNKKEVSRERKNSLAVGQWLNGAILGDGSLRPGGDYDNTYSDDSYHCNYPGYTGHAYYCNYSDYPNG